MHITSGTLTLQQVSAAEATVIQNGDQVQTKDLDLQVRVPSGALVRAKAEEGVFYIGKSGGKRPPDSESITENFIRQYAREFDTYGDTGDMHLKGSQTPVRAEIGNEGTVETTELVWSERLQKYLVPVPFRQWATMRDGSRVETRGDAAYVDREFREWTYYGEEKGASEIIFDGAARNKGGRN